MRKMSDAKKCPRCGSPMVAMRCGFLMAHKVGGLECQLVQRTTERDRLFFKLDELQCDIASALGWDCHGIAFHRLVRGYVMAHEMERAEVARLKSELREAERTGRIAKGKGR